MPSGDPAPFATVVVPTRNEAASIERCLAAIAAQDYPRGRLEVLVVDGASSDGTPDLVAAFAASSPVPVRLLENPARSVPAALNIALAHMDARYLVRVDGHSEPEPGYVRACVEAAEELGAGLAGGWVQAVGTTAFGRAVAHAVASPLATGNAGSWRAPEAPREVVSVPCGAYRVDALRAIGGFDEGQLANQDYEANYRLRAAGWKVYILPGVHFAYTTRSTPRRLARQFARYGWFRARTMAKHPGSARPRHLAPSAALLVGLALAVAAPFSTAAALVLAVAVGLYVLALLVAAARAVPRLGRDAALLPLALATMHLAWAAGNVAGLARWLPVRSRLAR